MPEYLMEGIVDDLDRPILHLGVSAASLAIPCVVDTGFNNNLMMANWVALAHGFKPYPMRIVDRVLLADQSRFEAERMRGSIIWFGEETRVDVQVVADSRFERRYYGADQPLAILGTALLRRCVLSIDFVSRRLAIQKYVPVASGR